MSTGKDMVRGNDNPRKLAPTAIVISVFDKYKVKVDGIKVFGCKNRGIEIACYSQ
jgi:hypothetical protein